MSPLSLLSLMWILHCALALRRARRPLPGSSSGAYHQQSLAAASTADSFVTDSYKGKDVLVLGDGDFSYSVALRRLTTDSSCRITTSTRASTEELARAFPTAERNTRQLEESGVGVLYSVDATDLPRSLHGGFDTVIFNFPHIDGKQNIRYNRELLLGFLSSSKKALRAGGGEGGEIQVSLTSPQSGVSACNTTGWDQSWKLALQAAEAGLYIAGERAFPLELFASLGYSPSGRRGVDKSFGTYSPRQFTLRPCLLTDKKSPAVAVAAPVFVHEVHMLMNSSEPDTSALQRRVRQLLQEVCHDFCGGAQLGQSCLLVDTYHCPRTHSTSYVFQIAYACLDGSLVFPRAEANRLKEVVEMELPSRLGLEPRAEKHRGMVSAAHPFYMWAALHREGGGLESRRLSTNPTLS